MVICGTLLTVLITIIMLPLQIYRVRTAQTMLYNFKLAETAISAWLSYLGGKRRPNNLENH